MNKISISGLAVITVVVISGCSAKFSPSNRYLETFDSKSYLLPYATRTMGPKKRERFNMDDTCNKDDTLWIENDSLNHMFANYKSVASQAVRIRELMAEGTAGCSHPLSDQEYGYFMAQQNNRRYQEQQDSAANINTITQGLNGLTNQINTINNQQNIQNQQMQQQSQTYWQNQETNNQLKKINNNLNGLRYGY